jgi:hypothetical protein
MEKDSVKKSAKLANWIIVLGIIGLVLTSFLPWISIAETDSVKEDLHFNYEMIKKSENDQIKNLADDLDLISILFWVVIIVSIISFISITIHVSGKYSNLGHLIMLIGCTTLIFSILVVTSQLTLIQTIQDIDTISASAIFSHINYAYIPLTFGILLSVLSGAYTGIVVLYSIEKLRSSIKAKKEEKKISTKPDKKESETIVKKPPKEEKPALRIESLESKTDEKRVEMEQGLAGQIRESKETHVFPPEKIEEPVRKKINVRCPQCKYIFTFEKESGVTKIKCPKCGKEGVIK